MHHCQNRGKQKTLIKQTKLKFCRNRGKVKFGENKGKFINLVEIEGIYNMLH